MSRVWHIAAKELLQTRRDKLAALFTIVLPVIFTVFFGLLFGGVDDGSGKLPLAVADEDATRASGRLVQLLQADPLLEVEFTTAEAIDQGVQDQAIAAALLIPEGFGGAVDEGAPAAEITLVRIATSTGAQSVAEAVQAALGRLNTQAVATDSVARQVATFTGRALDDSLRAQAEEIVTGQFAAPAVAVRTETSGSGNVRQISAFDQASTGSLVNWVLFGLLTVAAGLVWERKRGLIRRISVAGVTRRELFGGKLVAMLIITFVQQLFLILLGQFAFGVDYFNSPAALLMVMVSLSVFAASIGLLIAAVFRSEQAVIATTVISAQLLAALGGAWFPLEVTSATFSRVAHFLPTSWVVDSLHGIISKDWGVNEVLGPLGIVWMWIGVLFVLAVWRFRPE